MEVPIRRQISIRKTFFGFQLYENSLVILFFSFIFKFDFDFCVCKEMI